MSPVVSDRRVPVEMRESHLDCLAVPPNPQCGQTWAQLTRKVPEFQTKSLVLVLYNNIVKCIIFFYCCLLISITWTETDLKFILNGCGMSCWQYPRSTHLRASGRGNIAASSLRCSTAPLSAQFSVWPATGWVTGVIFTQTTLLWQSEHKHLILQIAEKSILKITETDRLIYGVPAD